MAECQSAENDLNFLDFSYEEPNSTKFSKSYGKT